MLRMLSNYLLHLTALVLLLWTIGSRWLVHIQLLCVVYATVGSVVLLDCLYLSFSALTFASIDLSKSTKEAIRYCRLYA
jgi:hypothetical protein